jgi:hypothetical protein
MGSASLSRAPNMDLIGSKTAELSGKPGPAQKKTFSHQRSSLSKKRRKRME